jgi:uncharacterized protein YutE (UPF0331/DUF86 family)
VDARLEHLERACARLAELAAEPWGDLTSNWDLQSLIERHLETSLQDCIDVATHLVAENAWPVPASYGDAFRELGRRGVLDAAHAERMAQGAGLRNLLVHASISLAPQRLHEGPGQDVADLREFAARVAGKLGGG